MRTYAFFLDYCFIAFHYFLFFCFPAQTFLVNHISVSLSLSASKNLLSGKNKYLYLGGNMGQVDLLKLGSVDL